MNASLIAKAEAVAASVSAQGSAIVAYSGGVDSALVAAVAARSLGDRALAVTGVSASLARGEARAAAAAARALGIAHEFLRTGEFDRAAYRANKRDRCYQCKDELYQRLRELARARGYHAILDGTNADDGATPLDQRPGRQAASRHGARSPLADAGMRKADVRALAFALGVEVWNKPASPCLSSRVPYGTRIELDDLRRIDLAERYLRATGHGVVRVRHFGELARIEVPRADVPRLRARESAVSAALRAVGYARVEIDERGYRTGSLNES